MIKFEFIDQIQQIQRRIKKCNGSSTLAVWEGTIVATKISPHCHFNTVGVYTTDHVLFIA